MIGPLAGCPVIQLGCVVRDLDAAIAVYGGEWLRFSASPPSFYRDLRYVGGEAVLDHAVALRKREHPQVELIQPGVGRNVWADWIEEGHEGLHHLAVSVEEPYGVIPVMEAAGYEYLPHYEDRMPYRRLFHTRLPDATPAHWVNLHLVTHGHEFWERHLLFRDYLCDHPETAAEYERLKRHLATQFDRDHTGDYADAKTPFIRAVEDRARREREE